jgi:hypothetical protein
MRNPRGTCLFLLPLVFMGGRLAARIVINLWGLTQQ